MSTNVEPGESAGASYEEIAKAGGGIASTVKKTAAASDEELLASARGRLRALTGGGCTTVEVKTGYGLDVTSELRLLRLAAELGQGQAVRIVPTLLALHAIPADQRDRRAHYSNEIIDKLLPAAAKIGKVAAVDAYCDTIAFRPTRLNGCSKRPRNMAFASDFTPSNCRIAKAPRSPRNIARFGGPSRASR